MEIKDLVGESYKEGMTEAEINEAIKDRKFADLSTGAYVDKGKYENAAKERDALKGQLADLQKASDASSKELSELKAYKEKAEAEKASNALSERILKAGVRKDMVDFVKFQVESGKIERGEKDAKLDFSLLKFVEENPQYSEAKTNGSRISTNIGDGQKEAETGRVKTATNHPWNSHRR